MTYELLVIPKEWLFTPFPGQFDVLTDIINKLYSKAMAKYGIVQSTRIKHSGKFLSDFLLTPEKDVFLLVLLGSHDAFRQLKEKEGYERNFVADVFPLSGAFDSDVPAQYMLYFGELSDERVKITTLTPGEALTEDAANRVLATAGFKTFHELDPLADDLVAKSEPTVKEYELTSYGSFGKRMGPRLLDYAIDKFVADPHCVYLNQKDITGCVLHAVVIREHDLVPYYTHACRFVPSGKADAVYSSGKPWMLEDGVITTQDIHLAFLRRDIEVRV